MAGTDPGRGITFQAEDGHECFKIFGCGGLSSHSRHCFLAMVNPIFSAKPRIFSHLYIAKHIINLLLRRYSLPVLGLMNVSLRGHRPPWSRVRGQSIFRSCWFGFMNAFRR